MEDKVTKVLLQVLALVGSANAGVMATQGMVVNAVFFAVVAICMLYAANKFTDI